MRAADDLSMRLVAVSRVMNEDDIIEAFVRHTLAIADHLLVHDNGSTDNTLHILAALRAEGLPITVLQARSPIYCEIPINTLLYHTARQALAPDWVLHLDADEFLDEREADLRERLASIPADLLAAKLPLRNYYAEGLSAGDLLVPRRMVLRDAQDRGISKVMLRGNLPAELVVGGGNHEAAIGTDALVAMLFTNLPLAHYPERDPVQAIAKSVLGRLKVLAAGGGPERTGAVNAHYTPVLDRLRADPSALLMDQARMSAALPPLPLVEDPIRYAGGELRHTLPGNPSLKAVHILANAMALLAESHGALLDSDPAARARLEEEAVHAAVVIA